MEGQKPISLRQFFLGLATNQAIQSKMATLNDEGSDAVAAYLLEYGLSQQHAELLALAQNDPEKRQELVKFLNHGHASPFHDVILWSAAVGDGSE